MYASWTQPWAAAADFWVFCPQPAYTLALTTTNSPQNLQISSVGSQSNLQENIKTQKKEFFVLQYVKCLWWSSTEWGQQLHTELQYNPMDNSDRQCPFTKSAYDRKMEKLLLSCRAFMCNLHTVYGPMLGCICSCMLAQLASTSDSKAIT